MEKNGSPDYDHLFETILKLKNIGECRAFFDDLLTVRELHDLAQRLEVAEMLDRGMCYLDIVAATGASTATISRVNKALHYGSDGYKTVIARPKEEQKSN